MGSSWSSVFSGTTLPETKQILNTILKRLISEVDMRDMYSLADPRMCKEYIIFASSALSKLFATVQINKEADGILWFQKIKGLQEKNPDPQLQQQRCKELAFYFIRIFQIYAAIALSIMDSELPSVDPVEIIRPREERSRGALLIRPGEGLRGFPKQQSSMWGRFFGQSGGALHPDRNGPADQNYFLTPERAGPYAVLNTYLVVPDVRDSMNPLAFKIEGSGKIPMVITQDSLYDVPRNVKDFVSQLDARPRIMYDHTRGEERVRIEANLMLQGDGGNLQVTLQGIQVSGRGDAGEVTRTLQVDVTGVPRYKGSELPIVLKDMFREAYDRIVPQTFSAADFLRDKGLLRGTEIEGSHISVNNPRDERGDTIRITYKTSHKIDERARQIEISADLIITKKKKIEGQSQEYIVKVDTNNLETNPAFLRGELKISQSRDDERFRGREKSFSTGQADSSRPLSKDGKSIPLFLETAFKNMLSEEGDVQGERDGIRYTREGYPEPLNSDQIPKSLRIKEIWKALAKDPPIKPHCIARAMQLLNLSAIQGTETREAFSSICRVKFPYSRDGSLPPVGRPITEEYGISALAMLFVDNIETGSPKIGSTEQYKEFRRKFKLFFERYDVSREQEAQAPERISDIQEKIMPDLCTGHTRDRIRVEGGIVNELRAKARALIERQNMHIQNCMTILFKVFDERAVRSGRFEISEYVGVGGMEAVNAVAEEARNILAQYYGDCEETYREGVYVLYNHHMANKETDRATKYVTVDTDEPARPPTAGGSQ
jgi:hypothetical protein